MEALYHNQKRIETIHWGHFPHFVLEANIDENPFQDSGCPQRSKRCKNRKQRTEVLRFTNSRRSTTSSQLMRHNNRIVIYVVAVAANTPRLVRCMIDGRPNALQCMPEMPPHPCIRRCLLCAIPHRNNSCI